MNNHKTYEIIQPAGILDGDHAKQVFQKIGDLVKGSVSIVLLDMQEVTFMDSAGLGALVSSLKAVRSEGGKLYICSMNDQLRMLFELTSMDRVFEIFPNRDEFEKAMGVPSQMGRETASEGN